MPKRISRSALRVYLGRMLHFLNQKHVASKQDFLDLKSKRYEIDGDVLEVFQSPETESKMGIITKTRLSYYTQGMEFPVLELNLRTTHEGTSTISFLCDKDQSVERYLVFDEDDGGNYFYHRFFVWDDKRGCSAIRQLNNLETRLELAA